MKDEHIGREYQRILKRYRLELTRADLGLPPRRMRGRPAASPLRQTDLDEALGGGTGVYQKVESGTLLPSREHFQRIATLLRISPIDYRIAHMDLFGTEPALDQEAAAPCWERVIKGQKEAAFLAWASGEVAASNAQFARIHPSGRAPSNMWHWLLLAPDARDETLVRWDDEWAPFLLTEFRLALARSPEDPVLHSIRDALRTDTRSARIEPATRGLDHVARPFYHAGQGLGTARFTTAHPDGTPTSLVTILFDRAA
ncbi:sulfotransferase [Streptomyces sp. NPDC001933]|uniref:MmyB family transcriptional regulator n=1 Tax=Streptomyces sp. NPDC001933 TaxID=3364626 RepID=UPI0036A1D4A3